MYSCVLTSSSPAGLLVSLPISWIRAFMLNSARSRCNDGNTKGGTKAPIEESAVIGAATNICKRLPLENVACMQSGLRIQGLAKLGVLASSWTRNPGIALYMYTYIYIYIYRPAPLARCTRQTELPSRRSPSTRCMEMPPPNQPTGLSKCVREVCRESPGPTGIYIYMMYMLHPFQFPRTASQVIETVWKASQQSDIVSVAFLRYSRFSKPRSSTLLNVKSFDPAAMTCGVDYTYCRVLLRVAETLGGFDNCV